MLCVWVHGCDPGRVSDGSRLALSNYLYRVPFFYIFLACVFCYCSFLFVVLFCFLLCFLLSLELYFVDLPLIFFCPADHVPDWQPPRIYTRILLGMVEARSVNVKTAQQHRALEITACESIETTLRTRRLLWAGTLLRMSGGRLPKRIVFGNLEGAVRRGRGGKEKEWTDCVQSDIRAFGIAGDWKATALNAEVWVETVTEGGRRFMAAWRKEEVDAARHRQEKREATRLGTLLSQTGV